MTAEQFAYWLQGFAEMTPEPPSAAQWQMIREHVATVFGKVTPPLRAETPPNGRIRLDEIQRILRTTIPDDGIVRPYYPRDRGGRRDRLIC